MSGIVAYEAWRFPARRLNDWIRLTGARMTANVEARFDSLVWQRFCPHPDARMHVVGVYDHEMPGGRFKVSGDCLDCGLLLPGAGRVAPGVVPVKSIHDVAGMMQLSREKILATDCVWEREGLPPGESDEMARWRINRVVLTQCREASKKETRDPYYDLDCGWSVRIVGDDAIVTPRGEAWTRKGLELPTWARDVSYWETSEKPDEITAEEWRARKLLWHRIAWGKGKLPIFTHKVVDLRDDFVGAQLLLQDRGRKLSPPEVLP